MTGPPTDVGPRRGFPLGVLLAPVAAAVIAGAFAGANHLFDTSVREDYSLDESELSRSEAGGDTARRAGFLTLAGFGAAGLLFGAAGRVRAPLLARGGGAGLTGCALAGLFGWWSASTLWSDNPALSARRIAVLGLFLLGAAGAAKALTGRRLAVAAVGAVSLHLAAGVAAELALGTFRPWSPGYRFAGTIHPNIQALQLAAGVCGCAALAGAGRATGRGGGWLLWGAVLLGFLILTKSRTATAGAVLAVGGAGLAASHAATKLLAGAAAAAGAAGLLIAVLLAGSDPGGDVRDAALMGRTEQQNTLSGRLPIWEALVPHIAERPWVGHGYGAFWTAARVDAVSTDVGWALSASHSAWFESAAEAGVVGVGLLAAVFLLGALRSARLVGSPRHAGDPLPFFALALTLLVAANAFTEALVNDVRLVPLLLWAALAKVTVLPDRDRHPAPRRTETTPPTGGPR